MASDASVRSQLKSCSTTLTQTPIQNEYSKSTTEEWDTKVAKIISSSMASSLNYLETTPITTTLTTATTATNTTTAAATVGLGNKR